MKLLEKCLEKIKMKARPFTAFQIEPTSRCQLKCVMCPRTVYSKEWDNGEMPLALYEKISRYFSLADNVHLQGWGEPLLHPEISLMIQMAKAENCKASLTTNGMLLTRDISEEFIKKGLDTVAVSLSGGVRETHENIRCGSHFEQIIDNIRTLANLKLKMRSKTPKIVLSFLMTEINIKELREAVILAKDSGINEFVATNLDYTPTEALDNLKAFSCNQADLEFQNYLDAARIRAKKIKLSFRFYPLEMEEVVMCEMNPLRIVFISHDGCVSPCVYLNMTKRGLIPRIFCNSHYEMQRLCFGNISNNDFMEIWTGDAYKNFRKVYHNRLIINRKAYSDIGFEIGAIDIIRDEEKTAEKALSKNPVPEVCRTCYKAYNI